MTVRWEGGYMAKHLGISERTMIERGLALGNSFKVIGDMIERSPSTISREVKRHRIFVSRNHNQRNDCVFFSSCLRLNVCPVDTCFNRCKFCTEADCRQYCESYEGRVCEELNSPPYVCNGCFMEHKCRRDHAYYSAHKAQSAYEQERSASRKGIRTSPEELQRIDELISPLVRKGQSINQILANHRKEIGLSEKTLYNYVSANVFGVQDIHLPRKVSYRPRKNNRPVLTHAEYKYRRGRTIEVFEAFRAENPELPAVEMDTVKSARGCRKCLLTFTFEKSNFLIAFLLQDATQRGVLAVFDHLTNHLGVAAFRELFPVILTDNGVEFKDPISLEHSERNCLRTRVFFCDPQASWQKPHIERSHVELRKILPKGTSFTKLTAQDLTLALCHVNSEPREVLGNQTPFDLFIGKNEKKLLDLLNLHPVPPDEVTLSPKLLNLRIR